MDCLLSLLSLGTGFSKRYYSYKEAKDWGVLEWIQPLIDIMMSGVSETVDYQLNMIFDAIGAPKQYLRINTSLPKGVKSDMDNASMENLLALKEHGTYLAEEHKEQIDNFIKNYLL